MKCWILKTLEWRGISSIAIVYAVLACMTHARLVECTGFFISCLGAVGPFVDCCITFSWRSVQSCCIVIILSFLSLQDSLEAAVMSSWECPFLRSLEREANKPNIRLTSPFRIKNCHRMKLTVAPESSLVAAMLALCVSAVDNIQRNQC